MGGSGNGSLTPLPKSHPEVEGEDSKWSRFLQVKLQWTQHDTNRCSSLVREEETAADRLVAEMKATAAGLAATVATLAFAGGAPTPRAFAGGGRTAFDGGTPNEQAQVRAALEASAFDWNAVPVTVTVHIARGIDSSAAPGQIWLDADLLDAGTYAWGIVQHEYAHQVDFFLLTSAARVQLLGSLGGVSWWQATPAARAPDRTLQHAQLASERFASTLAWSYWPSPANALRPQSRNDEAGALAPATFRRLLAGLLGATAGRPQ